MVEVTDRIIEVLESTGSTAFMHYVDWYVVSSIVWVCFGSLLMIVSILCIIGAYRIVKRGEAEGASYEDRDKREGACIIGVIAIVFLFVGVITVSANAIDLIEPEGMAIHQMLKDISGK
jgi:cbb3-type cytochrome oxidase subunit 3